ncbi:MAG: OmpW family protein [Alphaproteobacteria bacterium]|nr:OmpW family protein [Alphaproteobacteria bacterium SS10]
MRFVKTIPGLAITLGLALSAVAYTGDARASEPFVGKQAGDFMIRARGILVEPDEDASIDTIGGTVDIDEQFVPEVDFSYFITDHIALELIAAVTPHDVTATNTSLGNVDLGDVLLLPPTLTLQYHMLPEKRFSPYVGAGVNATFFIDDDVPSGGPVNSIDYDPSVGFALQAGVDYFITDNILLNFDVKKVFINTDVDVNTALGTIGADVDIDPWIIGVGVGWKF